MYTDDDSLVAVAVTSGWQTDDNSLCVLAPHLRSICMKITRTSNLPKANN